MTTIFMATIIGWYMVVFSLLLLLKYNHMKSVMADIMSRQGEFFIFALLAFILGLIMVVSHNLWVNGWPVCVTIVSWSVLISGLLRLFIPNVQKRAQAFSQDPIRVKSIAVVFLIVGLYLLYHVFFNS